MCSKRLVFYCNNLFRKHDGTSHMKKVFRIQLHVYEGVKYMVITVTQSLISSFANIFKLILMIIVLYTSSCTNDRKVDSTPPKLYPQPKIISANPPNGYSINPVSGDSILPIILGNGDTLQTGKPIPAKWKEIHQDSVTKPKRTKAPTLEHLTQIKAHQNITSAPLKPSRIFINEDTLTRIPVNFTGNKSTSHFLLNSKGDTVRTGVPIIAKAKHVQIHHPKLSPAFLPRFKDNALSNIQYLDVDQGMISSYVFSTLADNKGNIWFGTNAGLSKYDGTSFLHFNEKDGISSNIIYCIYQDKKGRIWLGTYGGGVCMYNGSSFTHYTENEGLTLNDVSSIIEDRNGNMWFATYGGGVTRYDGKHFVHFTQSEGLTSNNVSSMLEDKKGNIWFGTNGGGVTMYNGKSFVHFTQSQNLMSNPIYSIIEDNSGNIWFSTNGSGVSMYNGQSFTQFTEKDGLIQNVILSAFVDNNGYLWFGSERGIAKYNGHTFENITIAEGLSHNYITDITQDKRGNFWICTSGGGVSIYKEHSFVHLDTERGLSNNSVRSIIEDKHNNLWFGTNSGGVTRYDGNSFFHYTDKYGPSWPHIWSMLEDKEGNIWFGKNGGGVSKFDGTYFTHYTETQGLSEPHVFSIIQDSRGNIWFGTKRGGICVFDGLHFKHFSEKEGLSNNNIWDIHEDHIGNIWVATAGGGVTKYDGTTFTHYTEREGLSSNVVISIYEDKYGNLWFGTYDGGITIYNGRSFIHFTEKEGLSNNSVRSIQNDNKGGVWASTKNGITYFELKQKTKIISNDHLSDIEYHINRIIRNDGLKGMDFFRNSSYIDSKNRIWWGSGKGLTMLDLNSFRPALKPPVVNLQQVDINELFIDYRNIKIEPDNDLKFTSVQSFFNYPLDLELPYDKNHLTFHFSAIDWSAPHKIQYSYLMHGLNSMWSQPSQEAKVDYRNIPYGTYTFKVRAIGESGVWSKPFEYTFTILPPWWHTWWARTIYTIMAFVIFWGIIRWRTSTLKLRQRELQVEINLATSEILKQKEEIEIEKERSEILLLNILPEKIAEELKRKGNADAQLVDHVTVLFTDFKDFTALSEKISPNELVSDLHNCFSVFDKICEKHNIEKIKTIGDAYMAAGGLPSPNTTHAHDVANAAIEMANFIKQSKDAKLAAGLPYYEMRIGIHTGPVVAGIVGIRKFQYDIWGDTVNTASRMESSSEPGRINISETTYQIVKDDFKCTYRGKIQVKGKGIINMYFVES